MINIIMFALSLTICEIFAKNNKMLKGFELEDEGQGVEERDYTIRLEMFESM